MPKISIVIPFHWMEDWEFFMGRCLRSVEKQSFKDYEVILTKAGLMAENTNRAIESAKGELIKILYMDDYFADSQALQVIVDNFKEEDMWLATGCLHKRKEEVPHSPHLPEYTADIHTGNNRIGSPSVITLRNKGLLLFDENLSFLLDCDLYRRYYDEYGPPKLLNDLNVVIGLGEHQTSQTMPSADKFKELNYMLKKYAK